MTRRLGRMGATLLALVLLVRGNRVPAAMLHDALAHTVRAHPGRIIVKYRPTVRACAHCLLARGVPFASVTGTDSVDELNRRYGVRGARAVFFERHGVDEKRSTDYFARLAAVRDRFAARSARVPANAQAPDLSRVYILDLPRGANVAEIAARYAADPNVEYAQPDYEMHTTVTSDDPFLSSSGTWGQPYADLWGLEITQATQGWDTATGNGIVVAVVDTGVDYGHPDLAANMWRNPGEIAGNGVDDDGNGFIDDVYGYDFVHRDGDPLDDNGHGTHVAGTIAAVGNNGIGVVGMAWGARIMAVKGIASDGFGDVSDLAAGIVYAAQNGADVLNNSWGGYVGSGLLTDAVATATALGVVVVASAGNDAISVDAAVPASIPQVIAVGASQPGDVHAGFSNYGDALSVSAPGVDVLSLRGAASAPVGGQVVAGEYLRLSGTSMAAPHVAGLSAVLLSALPNLTPDEVRWHLELNADQPGYPGYEGDRWNPYFGWGRINAARVFDPPPVATKIHRQALQFHSIAGGVTPDAGFMKFSFTTHDPVAWTVSSPPWLIPSITSGAGPAQLTLALDTSAAAVGVETGALAVSAPAAIDGGGGGGSATVYVHSDRRIGGEIPVANGISDFSSVPQVASDGLGSLAVWSGGGLPPKMYGARIDGAGNVSGPAVLTAGGLYKYFARVATDGRNFFVVWMEDRFISATRLAYVKGMRIAPNGEPIDTTPIVIESHRLRANDQLFNVKVGFDGEAYTVLWGEIRLYSAISPIYIRRVGTDGTLRGTRRKIYPAATTPWPQLINPEIACVRGQCLVAWKEADGEKAPDTHKWIDKAYGIRLVGEQVLDKCAFRIMADADDVRKIATNGTDYMVLMWRDNICPPVDCPDDIMAARVTPAGVSLDPNGFRLNNEPPQGVWSFPSDVTFDGTNYVATFVSDAPPRLDHDHGWYVFATRFTPDGRVLDSEPAGLLLHANGTAGEAANIAATRTDVTLLWADNRFDQDSFTFSSIYAQRALAHQTTFGLSELEIGSIGPRSVAERTALAFTVTASSLNSATATFSATNLPPGAVFDAATHAFRWMPAPDEAGVYPGVHFEATDGTQTVGEDVTVTVTEANLSICGTAQLPGGVPAADVALEITRTPDRKRTVFTDAAGRFCFYDLMSGTYTLRLTPPSTKQYGMPRLVVTLGATDVTNVNTVVVPWGRS